MACRPNSRYRDFRSISNRIGEKEVAERFVRAVNGSARNTRSFTGSLCPGYTLALSRGGWDPNHHHNPKIDGAFYLKDAVPTDHSPRWERQRLLVEFKRGGARNDPYRVVRDEADRKRRERVRAQLEDYVERALVRQQRTALFLLFVYGTKARVLRCDRCSIIYTEAFDYVQTPDTLRDVLWGFSLLSPEKQGLDLTAMPVEPGTAEYNEMDLLAKSQATDISEVEGTPVPAPTNPESPVVFAFVRKLFAESLGYSDWPRWKLSIRNAHESRSFLVGAPAVRASGVVGRGSRGYVAVDCKTKAFVWLKDTWRPIYPGVTPEGETLRILQESNAQNVPTLVFHGDLDQETRIQSQWRVANGVGRKRTRDVEPANEDEDIQDIRLRHLRHYRLVVSEICLPLYEFTCGRELVSVIRDCVRAHRDAANSSKRILHRDISFHNLLIYPTLEEQNDGSRRVVRRGILTDWELARSLCEDPQEAPEGLLERTGTWQFISVFSTDHPTVPMKIDDDIESFFYVLLYSGARFMRHNCADDVSYFLEGFFDDYAVIGKQRYSGSAKRCAMEGGRILLPGSEKFVFLHRDNTRHLLNGVCKEMLSWCHARYQLLIKRSPSPYPAWAAQYLRVDLDPPRAVMEERANRVTHHAALLDLLDQALEKKWPTDDKVGDQLARGRATPDLADSEGETEFEAEDVAADTEIRYIEATAGDKACTIEERPAKRPAVGMRGTASGAPQPEKRTQKNRRKGRGVPRTTPKPQCVADKPGRRARP